MKIGLISDTHSCWDDRFEKHFAGCDEIWHAGDIGNPGIISRLRKIAPVRAVYGNADGGSLRQEFKDIEVFEAEGVKVLLTHIGGYPGKYAPGIRTQLLRHKPKLMVCGHSHILKVIPDRMLGTVTINPGAAGMQGWQTVRTLIILSIEAGSVTGCDIIELDSAKKGDIITD